MSKKKILQKIGKNLFAFLMGAIGGGILLVLYFLIFSMQEVADKVGLGIIALLPVMIILYFILGIIPGGIIGIIIYQIIKRRKK